MIRNLSWVCILSLQCFITCAQGIVFDNEPSWQQILQKAKSEHKSVFVDCYATWCGPCKMMDKDIYPNDSIGRLMNDSFISVRVQMDTSREDSPEIAGWYATAHRLREQYQIRAYPSYLFFSPDGLAMHKDLGFKDINDFLAMVKAALDPKLQYYALMHSYQQGEKNHTKMPFLANFAKKLGEDSLASLIARDYMRNYLANLPEAQLWNRENIEFIGSFGKVLLSGDTLFKRYYNDRKVVDAAMVDTGYSNGLINQVIYREEIRKDIEIAIAGHFEPNWHKIERIIGKKFSKSFAIMNVTRGRVDFYHATQAWAKYAFYFIRKIEQAGIDSWQPSPMTSLVLNNDAFEVFKYSRKRKELYKALNWVDRAIAIDSSKPFAETLDTKANLLYKLGRIEEGKSLEAQSLALDPQNNEIVKNYEKMKFGLPTWPVQ